MLAATTSALVDDATLAEGVGVAAVLGATMALGAALRCRAWARTRELATVALVERERLARDLHDTVAHLVSAIAVRAQAGLATASTNPDAAADALRVIEAEASRTLTEMRDVGVLRDDEPAALTPGAWARGDRPLPMQDQRVYHLEHEHDDGEGRQGTGDPLDDLRSMWWKDQS